MKVLISFLFFIVCSTVNAQIKITKYYDDTWMEVSKEKATFYADFIKDGENYNCTSYWANSGKVKGKSTYADTVMQFPTGLQVLYFKNGQVEDSSFYKDKDLKYSYHYFPNRQLAAHYYLPGNKREGIIEGYDESGKRIKNYIFQKEAEFKGGSKAWASYISKHATKDFFAKGNSEETVTVQVQFIIDENGDVAAPKIRQSSGYKNVDNDALQIIADGPSWKNAIQYNKPVKAYRLQPIIYTLRSGEK